MAPIDSDTSVFNKLRRFNLFMGTLHLVQGVAMVYLGLTLENIKDFKLPLTSSFLTYNEALGRLVTQTEEITRVPIAIIVSAFLFLSATAHFLIVLPKLNDFYNAKLRIGINYFRWFEYAISSSLMIMMIAMLFGIYDIATLLMLAGLNATMNLLGLIMEVHNQTTEKTNWISFWAGCFAGIIPWIGILIYFLGSGEFARIPAFVYAILGAYFFFFNTFPINMYLQYKKVGKWSDYLYGERGYIILSLVSKSILAWIVFAGTLQPS
ncbi:heliorhodopsin HeR [Patescibacteria group bacterium]|nr:heliorhodopsin HeR [Patescibacteria group bacterium]MBU1868204.1 heliorhodopsin HeR [Patescibacteria group bacterium]